MNHLNTHGQTKLIKLASGLQLVLYQSPYKNTVSLNMRIAAGSKWDPQGKLGLAHLVEHMLFQGTKTRQSSYALTSQIESLGGGLFGATHQEYCSYWLNIPHRYFTQSLPIFTDMLSNPLFSADSIENEKKVIIDEIAEIDEQCWYTAYQLLDQALWPSHPLGNSIIGTKEGVQALSQSDVQSFFYQHYTPERMVAAVVGNISENEVINLFEQLWSHSADKISDVYRPNEPILSSARVVHKHNESNVAHLALGIKLPPIDDASWGAIMILQALLGQGMSSLLYTTLRGKGLCYSVDSDLDEFCHSTILSIYVATKPKQTITVIEEVVRTLHVLTTIGITEKQMDDVRKLCIGTTLMQADKAKFHSRLLSLSTFLTDKTLSVSDQITQLEQVTLNQLRELIHEALRPSNLFGGFYGLLSPSVVNTCQDLMTTNWSNPKKH